MKTMRATSGPFTERIYYPEQEIESICSDELASVGLLPPTPGPVRIERFIEKRFKVTHSYEELGDGILGLTRFTRNGVAEVVVSRRLELEGTQVSERRVRSTLAHEGGHCLLHAHLFALMPQQSLFESSPTSEEQSKVLCRGDLEANRATYSGEWWEYQANRAIGSLLMPRQLTESALRPFMIDIGKQGFLVFDRSRTEEAARGLAETFGVNPAVSRLRISQIFPMKSEDQLTF